MWNPATFGAAVQAGRKRQGLTQEALGERLGVTPQAVSKWERGEAVPDVGTLVDLAATLENSVDALLGTAPRQGVDALGRALRERLDGMPPDDRGPALRAVLGRLLLREHSDDAEGRSVAESAYHGAADGRLAMSRATLLFDDGSALYVAGTGGLPGSEEPDARIAEALAVLADQAAVGVLRHLLADSRLRGAAREQLPAGDSTTAAVDRLIAAGWLLLSQDGYSLTPRGTVVAAVVLRLAAALGLGCTRGAGLYSESSYRSYDRAYDGAH